MQPYRNNEAPACDAKTRPWARLEALLAERAGEIISAALVLAMAFIWVFFITAQQVWHLLVALGSLAGAGAVALFVFVETDGPRSHASAIVAVLFWLALSVISVFVLVVVQR